VYGVTTTGVCCRPACASRRPHRANVRFFDAIDGALAAGFRPCRRCRPDATSPSADTARLIERICRLIDDAEVLPPLGELAREAGLSPSHFHRVFRAALGVTPHAYAAARRRERLQRALSGAKSVTAAAYGAGYNSSARFYASAAAELGMPPSAYRRGGAAQAIRYAFAPCSLGTLAVAFSERGVCALDIGDDRDTLQAQLLARFPDAEIAAGDASLRALVARAVALVDGAPAERVPLALDIAGSAFAQRVWAALREIPHGETATYGEIAQRIGAPGSARAVAKACAANPVAVAVPCHRVVRGDGTPTDYRWGASRKRELLRRERDSR
jgi:AraC family transcriptional regulator of adaptative response/methylated-DNA-[protein]-cysteine methyltransferase